MPRFSFALSLLLLSFWCSLLPAQQSYGEPLDAYSSSFLPEKTFIHTDKNVYAGGETIYAAVYLLNGLSHQPDSISKTIYLELIDASGNLVKRLSLFAADGHMAATMVLPASIPPGDYQLAAYTNFQRNSYVGGLFRKSLRIVGGLKESGGVSNDNLENLPSPAGPGDTEVPSITLRFFPESGDCAVGIPCRVAFTSETEAGAIATFNGSLTTKDNRVLQTISTNKLGIGSFTYTPDGNQLAVKDELSGRVYQLPKAVPFGAHISVTLAKDTVDITMHKNDRLNGLQGHTFVLHLRGAGLLEQPFTSTNPRFKMRLPVALLPAGVVIATLLDAGGNPVAERLFFVPPDDTEVAVQLDGATYGLRQPVDLSLAVPQAANLVDSLNLARLSVSVLPAASAGGPVGDDIRTWTLLNSDVDHPIQQAPELIFGAGTQAEKTRRIDDFLLTRAWRRFTWKQLPTLSEYQPKHLLERGLFIRGRMTKLENENAGRPGKVFLARMSNGFGDETLTDDEGYFTLGPYFATDTFPIILQGRYKSGRKNRLNPDINLDDKKTVQLEVLSYEGIDWSTIPSAKALYPPAEQLVDYAEISRKTLTVARNFDSLIIDLQTIDVSASRIDQEEEARDDRTRQFYSSPTRRIVVADDAFAQTTPLLLDVLTKLNGVRKFTNTEREIFFNIRGAESADGAPLPAGIYLDGQLTRIGSLAAVPMRQVEFIDVLTPQRAVSLGPDAEGGAIMIYRYADGRAYGTELGVLETTLTGYHTVREFATFDASLPDNRNRPDLRTTLHWAPLLRSGSNGETRTSFTTSDQTGKFHIFIQGLRNDGTPLYGEGSFKVDIQR